MCIVLLAIIGGMDQANPRNTELHPMCVTAIKALKPSSTAFSSTLSLS